TGIKTVTFVPALEITNSFISEKAMPRLKNIPVYLLFVGLYAVLPFGACQKEEKPPAGELYLTSAKVGDKSLNLNNPVLNRDLPADQPLVLSFSQPLDAGSLNGGIALSSQDQTNIPLSLQLTDADKTVVATPTAALDHFKQFTLSISATLKSREGQPCK